MVSEVNRWTVTTSTAGLSRLNDFTHLVAVRKMKSNQPIHASNQNAVFEINPGHFKRPFQNQNSLLVKRQNDNTSPGDWPRKISP